VVAVNDPYQLRHREPRRVDLEVGRFVEVVLTGERLTKVVAIPRRAMGPGGRVGVVGVDNRLVLRTVSVVWREGETLFVDHGLANGERVVLTRLVGAADGMVLRPVEAKVGGTERPAPATDTIHPPAVVRTGERDGVAPAPPAEGKR